MKVDNEVKRAAAKVIEDATTPEDKLQRLFRYCRNSIKNVNDLGSGLSIEERSDRKTNKIPADTIRSGVGTGFDIDLLFSALATAAGFEARFAKISDRGQFFFNPGMAQAYFMRAYEVAAGERSMAILRSCEHLCAFRHAAMAGRRYPGADH